ncbi:NAD(P)-binding protein [Xylona heveae TC161]|uniref:NAD(P)-binding protein n=1 Tax=Xylona heveae (strain CBS 132557 / TC161) TaxID=1328760 RepID=A0A165H2E3_XYLHT|nr:NAD(P)-binding protein [Xylona heveae TC161]KZF22893.1 NAD(P)-binding protein [Xylona heveae TC161]
MTRVLLTGGSGFIAAHVLDLLLKNGHSVVTTVRSLEKAQKIKDAYPQVSKDKLDFAIVEDISKPDAFDEAVKSEPPFEAVLHTASPFHFNVTDAKKDLLDPAIIGTTGILKAIKKSAPSVKRVVITSSFAAIWDQTKKPGHVYSEQDWNQVTLEDAEKNPADAYRASKTFAERAAWEFVEKEKPNFTVATINPPMVFGPVINYLNDLSSINTSNSRVADLIQGKWKNEIPPTGLILWVDVRDVALAHVKAFELDSAAGKRHFIIAGYYSNKETADIVRKNFPELASKLPTESTPGGDYPEGAKPGFDNSRAVNELGIKFRPYEESVVDLVKSLQAIGA